MLMNMCPSPTCSPSFHVGTVQVPDGQRAVKAEFRYGARRFPGPVEIRLIASPREMMLPGAGDVRRRMNITFSKPRTVGRCSRGPVMSCRVSLMTAGRAIAGVACC